MSIATHLLPFLAGYPGMRDSRWVKGIFYIGLAFWLLSLLFMTGVQLSGDEIFYFQGAHALAQFLRGEGPGLQALAEKLVGYGWFMPGSSIVMTPLFLVFDNPPLLVIRVYASVLCFLLWIWMIRDTNKHLGPAYGFMLLIFPTLNVTWQFFNTTIWADLPAGMLMLIALARSFSLSRTIMEKKKFIPKEIFVIELILALMVYLRGSSFVVALALHIFWASLMLLSAHWRHIVDVGKLLLAGAAIFVLLLSPWSVAASSVLGGLVLTTSTVPLSMGITFGDRSQLCFGPCPKDKNIWFSSADFSRFYAAKNGTSQIAVQKQMAKNALKNISVKMYLYHVENNFVRYALKPSGFDKRFISYNSFFSKQIKRTSTNILYYFDNTVYFLFLLLSAVANSLVFRARKSEQMLSLLIKLGTACMLIQPLVHVSHPRYWVTFAPLMALATTFTVASISRRLSNKTVYLNRQLEQNVDGIHSPLTYALFYIQAAYSVSFISFVLLLIFIKYI